MASKKKVRMTLIGLNGNAFSLMGAFQGRAREQGWSQPDIKAVLDKAMDGDYNHLLRTLSANIEDTYGEDDDDDSEVEFEEEDD